MMDNQKQVDDLVQWLDESVQKGVGHVSVETEEGNSLEKQVQTMGSLDCAKGNLACKIPNLT
ncbi:hypothetical protein FACS189418_4060 [Clostridia bacterium]|nr:hypothetical protein FACS189418_4060 [Clostridia bacterium]